MKKKKATRPETLSDMLQAGVVLQYETLQLEARSVADADTDHVARKIARRMVARAVSIGVAALLAIIYLPGYALATFARVTNAANVWGRTYEPAPINVPALVALMVALALLWIWALSGSRSSANEASARTRDLPQASASSVSQDV